MSTGRRRSPSWSDWVRVGVFVAGVSCVLTGLLPLADAEATGRRIAPLLLFLACVIVLATLAGEALVFDVIAARLAIVARGSYLALFGLCVGFAAATTMVLNLDTTAVLITPVLLALAARAGIATVPLAMTTIWLANTASLLLPVSNLTNLLAADRLGVDTAGFVARMWLPQLVAVALSMAWLWGCYWRRGRRGADRYRPPPPVALLGPGQPALFWITGGACALFVVAIPLTGDRIGVAALVAAAVAATGFAVLDRAKLRPGLVPWRLLILVSGLFLVVPALTRHGLGRLVTAALGADPAGPNPPRVALGAAALANGLNNLPAYVVGEAALPADDREAVWALLIGTNVGSVVVPWASLATLLCLEACRRHGVRIPMPTFVLTGLGLAATTLVGCVAALRFTG